MREAIVRVPARVEDAFGKTVQGELLVTTFRPPGPGPFPLVVISHGRDTARRAEYKRMRYESAARYFVRKGFAVAVPLRLGYGELASAGDPESSVSCEAPRFGAALRAAAEQILTVQAFMARQPDIDASRTVLVGVSVGGIATLAATSAHVPGQVAAINFAGGHGGDPEKHPGDPCQSDQLRRLYRAYAEGNARTPPPTPTLWIYAENDQFFNPGHARRWAKAYAEAGGQVDLRVLPAFGTDGHKLFTAGNDVWQPLVDEFLAPLGFAPPGRIASPCWPPRWPASPVRPREARPNSSSASRSSWPPSCPAPSPSTVRATGAMPAVTMRCPARWRSVGATSEPTPAARRLRPASSMPSTSTSSGVRHDLASLDHPPRAYRPRHAQPA